MDYGPVLAYTINCENVPATNSGNLVLKGLGIKLGNQTAVCFDTELLRYAAGWTGGFLDLSNTHLTSYKGSREALIGGPPQFQTRPVRGCSQTGEFNDPRPLAAGPLPREMGRWKGFFRHGEQIILNYTVGDSEILELPGSEIRDGKTVFTRTIEISTGAKPLEFAVCDVSEHERYKLLPSSDFQLDVDHGRVVMRSPRPATVKLSVWRSSADEIQIAAAKADIEGLRRLCRGGPAHWPEPITTKGRLGFATGAYVVDSITLPEKNPWNSWVRLVAFDFFSDGRAAVSTWNGDVWLVSGIDESLSKTVWRRFAAGLHEPLGLKIVNDVVHALGRDGITRLRDLNGDGEADFYENFNSDVSISPSYHAFAMDLQTDRAGNFYHARCGQRIDPRLPLNGGIVRVSSDGSRAELIATGLRAANGLAVGPNDEVVCSDNQGNWIPSSRINMIKHGGFYGYMPHARREAPPTCYDEPLCWLPVAIDNSGGSQAWVTSQKWGPLHNKILHTSYGKSALFLLLAEEVDGQWQGGAIQFPLKFESGIMRARFHPIDGQLYVCGLKGWQTTGARDGCFQRVRYTGKPVKMPYGLHVGRGGMEIKFTTAVDAASATDTENWAVEQWNYKWSEAYGSPEFSVKNPLEKGRDPVSIAAITLSADRQTVFLKIPEIAPVMQMRIQFRIKTESGEPLVHEIYNTLNKVPIK